MTDKRISKSFTYDGRRYWVKGATEQEAMAKLIKKRAEVETGIKVESNMTLDTWWEKYLDIYKKGVDDYTIDMYQQLYNKKIHPKLGRKRIKDIRQWECQAILNSLNGLSTSYIHKIYILMNGVFEKAVDNDLIIKSPMRGLVKPEGTKGERRPLTIEEREIFLEAVEQCGDAGYYGKLIYYCGLRPSEAMRVQAEDFDRKRRILRVRGTKSKSSIRNVPVPLVLSLPEQEEGLLFPRRDGGIKDKNGQRNYWLKIKLAMEDVSGEDVADDLTAYCLRHDFGTRCIEAGIDVETVSKMMGHADVALTSRVYLHETETTLQNAREKMDVMYQVV